MLAAGSDDVTRDAIAFVEAHSDALTAVLRDRSRALSVGALRSLALTTALISYE
jgi:hypothetical protein